MAYELSNDHVTYDVTWPPRALWGSTVGYPSDSLASYIICKHFYLGFCISSILVDSKNQRTSVRPSDRLSLCVRLIAFVRAGHFAATVVPGNSYRTSLCKNNKDKIDLFV